MALAIHEPDYYTQVETGLLTLFRRLLVEFCPNEWQIDKSDIGLGMGGNFFFFVKPGAFPAAKPGDSVVQFDWQLNATIYVSFVEYEGSWAEFKRFRSAIVNATIFHPSLDNTPGVYSTLVESEADPQAFYLKTDEADSADGDPNFIVQDLVITARQLINLAGRYELG